MRFVGVDSPLPVDFNDTNPLVVPIPVEVQAGKQFTLRIEARQDLTASVVSGNGPVAAGLADAGGDEPVACQRDCQSRQRS